MEGIKPPTGLVLTGDGANWHRFKQQFQLYLEAVGLSGAKEERKIALFLNVAGEDAVDVFNSHVKPNENKTLNNLIEQFDAYVEPRKNIITSSFKFFNLKQEEGEQVDRFITKLKVQAKQCDFKDQEDRLVRDMIVIGIRDKGLQERLLREADIKLDQVISQCRAAEAGKSRTLEMSMQIKQEVDVIKKVDIGQGVRSKMLACTYCGKRHPARNCPAFGKKCANCNNYNHFAAVCRTRSIKNEAPKKKEKGKKIDSVQKGESDSDCSEDFVVDSVSNFSGNHQWNEIVNINGTNIRFKLDSGADCNTLSLKLYDKVKDNTNCLLSNSTVLVAYNNQEIKTVGTVKLNCIVKGKQAKLKFCIVDLPIQPVIGLPACVELNLLKRLDAIVTSNKENFVKANMEVFSGLGNIGSYSIKLKESVLPVVKPIRRVPQAIKDRLKNTLESYESRGIIEKVEGPTAWCNNLVIVEKPNKSLRLCLDPKELNKCILRENYQIPSPEEIYNSLAGKQIFSVLDMKDGFFQVMLDDKDKLCTFGTPFGRYCFRRMPFGISSAPEVMQKINTAIFSDIQGVYVYFDDLIVAGDSLVEHDKILSQVIDRAKKHNVKFNENKIQYRCETVKYVGLMLSKSGIKPDPEHVKAIEELKQPRSVKELQKFLGMCNYLSKFIPQYSKTTEPLRELLKKEVVWDWGTAQVKAFEEIKTRISSAPTLSVLKKNGNIVLQTDSSKSGMGACLLQEGKPLSFYSRCYTECQQRWAPIEKELFAICCAMDKYHQFIYGRRIIVESDHKPLVAIMSKDINKISARLQRMVLKLLKYDFEIRYVPGSKMYIADYLSRHYDTNNARLDPVLRELVHSINSEVVYGLETDLQVSNNKLLELKQETAKDANLQQIILWYNSEWPKNDKNIQGIELKKLYKLKDYLVVKDQLIFYENKILIPKHIRKEMISIVHAGHAGIVKCKKRARKVLYWPGMSRDIEEFVSKCKACEKYRPSNPRQPLLSHEIPDLPFNKVGVDVAHFAGRDYLVLVDYYSKWIEVKSLRNKTAGYIIKKLLSIFCTHGVPRYIVSDNMPFGSFEFVQFSRKFDIELIKSSPRYPQSNGLSEKAVGIVKGMLKKCLEDHSDFEIALLHYRTTPVAGLEYSPSELLMSRLLRTNLPCTQELLKPKVPLNVREQLMLTKEKSRAIYNKTAKDKKSFTLGDNVIIQNAPNKEWCAGKVIGEADGPRSFIVKNEKSNLVRRNERHIRPSKNKFIVRHDSVPDNLLESQLEDIRQGQQNNELDSTNDNVTDTDHTEAIPERRMRSGRVTKMPLYLREYELS